MSESQLFENLCSIMPFEVYVTNIVTNEIIYMNQAMKKRTKGLGGTKCWEKIYGKEEKCDFCKNDALLDSTGKPGGTSLSFEVFDEYNDTWYQVQEKAISMQDGLNVKYSIAVNIMKQKNMQKSLAEAHALLALDNKKLEKNMHEEEERHRDIVIQQSKMAAMGEMTAIIAHQWKQPLSHLSLLSDYLKDISDNNLTPEAVKSAADQLQERVGFLNKTIDTFTMFYKKDKYKREFNIKQAVLKTADILHSNIKQASAKIEITGEDLKIYSVENEFQQVVLDLIKNSLDAALEKRERNPLIKVNIEQKEGYKEILVSDNTGGIPENILDKIFDIHFTTKQEKGTGMGLYMSKLIVENTLKGTMSVSNEEGGVKFSIKVPDGE